MKTTFFDIETGPLPDDKLRDSMPEFSAPPNWKDADKIAANIEEQRAKWIERAALSPTSGRILAIGYADDDGKPTINADADEASLIVDFFACARIASGGVGHLVGFNIFGFDLPFIVRRAWMLGIKPPACIMPAPRYWPSYLFTDLRDVWALGERQPEGSLDSIGRALGIGRKAGSGASFAAAFNGTPEERAGALLYLANDIELTRALYRRIVAADVGANTQGKGAA